MKKDKNLDELFRSKLQNYEQEPPAYLLENILAGAAGARRKRMIVLWRVAGVAAALLLAFVAGLQFNSSNETGTQPQVIVSQQSVPENAIQAAPENETLQAAPENIQLAAVNKPAKNNEISTKSIRKASVSEKTMLLAETLPTASNDETILLKPLKSMYGLLTQNLAPANLLQQKKSNEMKVDYPEKSIDQQILEQNQQLMLTQNQEKGKGRWLVGAQVSPEYNVSRSSHSQVYASNMLNASSTPVDLGGGISVEFKKGKRWSLQSGVYYSGMGQSSGNSSFPNRNLVSSDYSTEHGKEYFNAPVNIDSKSSKMMMNSAAGVIEFSGIPSGIVLGTNLEDKSLASNAVVVSDASFIQNFEYIEIPLYLRYTIIDSRFGVEMLGGFSSNVLVGNNTYMESNTGKSLVGSTQNMESLNYSGTLGIGLKYGLSKRFYLNVEPRVKYYLNSLNSNSDVTYKPYTIGVFTGLSYEF